MAGNVALTWGKVPSWPLSHRWRTGFLEKYITKPSEKVLLAACVGGLATLVFAVRLETRTLCDSPGGRGLESMVREIWMSTRRRFEELENNQRRALGTRSEQKKGDSNHRRRQEPSQSRECHSFGKWPTRRRKTLAVSSRFKEASRRSLGPSRCPGHVYSRQSNGPVLRWKAV